MLDTPTQPPGLLYIDDEANSLKYFSLAFSDDFTVFTASSGEEGLKILDAEADKICIVVSDQKMEGMTGVEVLSSVREKYPNIVRILVTAYTDLDSAIQAVNLGHIYQYITKPWEIEYLSMILQRAADYYRVIRERNDLLRVKMGVLQRMVCADRLKSVLLLSEPWQASRRDGFRRAVLGMVEQLSEFPDPADSSLTGLRAKSFDVADVLWREYEATAGALPAIDSIREGARSRESVGGELCRALESECGLPEASMAIDILSNPGEDARVVLRIGPSPGKSAAIRDAMFTLFSGAKIGKASLRMLELLACIEAPAVEVHISMSAGDALPPLVRFNIAPREDATSAEQLAIRTLYAKFSNWDLRNR